MAWYSDVVACDRRLPVTTLPEDFQHLSIPERIALAQALWDSIAGEPRPPLSDAKRGELARREAEDDAKPDEVVPWEQAKAELLARLGGS
jgi:putative addiction module component (TIGR02574 family)